MDRILAQSIVLASLALFAASAGKSQLVEEPDSDWPSGMEVGTDFTLKGNPLADGDEVYNLRGFHRFFVGNVGLEASIGYAEPTSDLARGLGGDVTLQFLDLSFVWYVSYHRHYDETMKRRKEGAEWHGGKRLKPEFIVFAGPGFASLKVDDAFPQAPLRNASRDFFTLNAGAGVKIHWMRTDEHRQWNHRTSRWYVRPEVRGRWIDKNVDWGVSVSLGYSFGKRPSQRALELKAYEACREVSRFKADAAKRMGVVQQEEHLRNGAMEHRERLEVLQGRVVACGPECKELRPCLEDGIDDMDQTLRQLDGREN